MIKRDMKSPVNIIAVIGLTLGGVFGLVGTVVTNPNLRAVSWGIDSVLQFTPARRTCLPLP
jgi:hypothetical protein